MNAPKNCIHGKNTTYTCRVCYPEKMSAPKHYYVPWEGYASGSQPEHRSDLDRLCLQGPHTLERAQQLAAEMRQSGCLASVIDCSETLRMAELAPEMFAMLQKILRDPQRSGPMFGEIADLLARAGGLNG